MTGTVEFTLIDGSHPDFSRYQATLRANLGAIAQRWKDLAQRLATAFDGRDWDLYVTPRFEYGVCQRDDGACRLLTDFDAIATRQRGFMDAASGASGVLILGFGIGEYLLALAEAGPGTSERRVFILAPETSELLAALCLVNITDILSWPGLQLLPGIDALRLASPETGQWLLACAGGPTDLAALAACRRALDAAGCTHRVWPAPDGWPADTAADLRAGDPMLERRRLRNIALLRDHADLFADPGLCDELAALANPVLRNPQGVYGTRIRSADGTPMQVWTGTATGLDRALATNNVLDTWMILGAGDGEVLRQVFAATRYTGPWPGHVQVIYLVEPLPALFGLLLCLLDLEPLLAEGRLRLFVGHDAEQHLERYFSADDCARQPNKQVALHHYQDSEIAARITVALRLRDRRAADRAIRAAAELKALYGTLARESWRERLAPDGRPPLRVMGLTSRCTSFLQYSTRDLLRGFERLGCATELLIEPDTRTMLPRHRVIERMDAFRPDLFVTLDHIRQEHDWLPERLPYVCWIQDLMPRLLEDEGTPLGEFDFTYAMTRHWEDALRRNPAFAGAEIGFAPVCADDEVFRPLPGEPAEHDVSYVSHLMELDQTLYGFRQADIGVTADAEELRLINDGVLSQGTIAEAYRRVARAVDATGLGQLSTLITRSTGDAFVREALGAETCRRHPALVDLLVSYHQRSRLIRDVLTVLKVRPLQHLARAGFGVAVFGNQWDRLADLRPFARGALAHGEALNRVTNRSAISLNNSGGISLHMRAVEIMAAGGFMLSRRPPHDHQPLTTFFRDGEEVVQFDELEDLESKVAYFLGHEAERREIAERARAVTLGHLTYEALAGRIIADLRARLG